MLVAFHVENFKSFKERASLLLEPAKLKEHPENCHTLTLAEKAYPILKSAVIYGPNASGKSNLIEALAFMRNWILNPGDSTTPIPTDPYALKSEWDFHHPSIFIAEFFLEGSLYEYGFKINREAVKEEWLTRKKYRKQTLFHRQDQHFTKLAKDVFLNAEQALKSTHQHRLFLKTADLFKNDVTSKIILFFQNLSIISGLDMTQNQRFTRNEFLNNKHFSELLLEFIRMADFGLDALDEWALEEPVGIVNTTDILQSYTERHPLSGLMSLRFVEKDGEWKTIGWPFFLKESQGTQQYFALAGPILDALIHSKVLVIDELDVRLHPHLIAWVVELFHRANRGAQLIFVSQNPYLLNAELMRQDQIWFVEKDKQGASQLYSLVEFRSESKRAHKITTYQQDYLYGRYGALPHLGSVDRILDRIADLKSAEAIPPSLNDSGIALSSAVNAQEQE